MKAAIYARVSTIGKGQDVDLQLRDLRSFAQRKEVEVYKEYIDDGVSGRLDSRPQLDLLMNDALKRRFDMVIVWRFDRFGRSTKHLVTALDQFRTLGIDFISYSENIDTSTPMGKVVFAIIAALAEFEADLIKERVIAGIANAKAKGIKFGRPGVNVDTKRLLALRNDQMSVRRIALELGLKKSTVHKTLKNSIEIIQ